MKTVKKIVFFLLLLLSLIYIFIVVSPRIFKNFYPFGIKTAIVLTGSMEPTLNVYDFVIVKKPTKVKVNDIVSYKPENGNNEVLHRVVEIKENKVITKGDANNVEDKPINKNQVTGIYIYKIKYLGNIICFIRKPIVFSTLITLFVITLFIPTKEKNDEE